MAKLKASETAGWNAGKNRYTRMMRVEEVKDDPDIAGLFNYQEKMVEEICRSILKEGFRKEEPITLWNDVVVDGRTRLAAARKAGLEEIPVVEKEFADKEEAILYTFERQVIRRNLTAAEIITAVRTLMGGKRNGKGEGRAAEELAERQGVSAAHIYQVQAILKNAAAEDVEAVRRGEKSTKEVYAALKPKGDKPAAAKPFDATLSNRLYLLSAAVTLLFEAKEEKAGRLLADHFFTEGERASFVKLLSEDIRKSLLKSEWPTVAR